jgi:hypothetical protein
MDSELMLTIALREHIGVAMENTQLNAQRMLATLQVKIDRAAPLARFPVDIEEHIRTKTTE